MSGRFQSLRRACALAALALFGLLQSAMASPQSAPVVEANIQAHPAMWTVRAGKSTAYLLGSIHLLPPNMLWRTPTIEAAMNVSDTFVFEAPLDDQGKAAVVAFVRAHGMLPDGTTLTSLLDPQARKDYEGALALAGLTPDRLDRMRPWLAAIALETSYMEKQHYSPLSGVDRQVLTMAMAEKKSLRYFETVDQQLSLLAPTDQKLEVKEFDAALHEFRTEIGSLGPFLDAWASGDAGRIARMTDKDLGHDPGVRKALLDDRNEAWIAQLVPMLAEDHTYFITVGAGHLAGPKGLPALLRARGYRVDGP